MVIRSLPGKHLELNVLSIKALEEVPDLLLRHGVRKVILTLVDVILGHIGVEVVHRTDPDPLQHDTDVILSVREILECCHRSSYFSEKAW